MSYQQAGQNHAAHRLLAAIRAGADPGPFALLRREGRDHIEVLTGDLTTVATLADIPLPPFGGSPTAAGPATLAVVPYRQITERGFACVDDGAPLSCLQITGVAELPLADALAALPDQAVQVSGGAFDVNDSEYARTVETVLRDEIGRGEGANFVIHRTFTASVSGPPLIAAAAALRRLLVGERGAYWTFLVHLGDRTFIGATPERHVSVEDGLVMMNPISGTHRTPPGGPDRAALLGFLADRKEIEELYMVLDEELKMMATVADLGGQVVGPYLKEMSRLAHTEYLLVGEGSHDVREVLRETMFAPTVTGSPIENACRVIARHERRGRGYYAGVLALLGYDESGRQTLDAPILIRTAEIDSAGRLRVPVGATLVRHSTTAGEVAETHTKAAGVLAALNLGAAAPGDGTDGDPVLLLGDDLDVRAALAQRNQHLSRFWLRRRDSATSVVPELAGRRILIVDAEDTFTGMLAHQLRSLGPEVTVRPYHQFGSLTDHDLVVVGPGPGDPRDPSDAKMAVLRGLVRDLLDRGQPMLAVCLGHQVLAAELGLSLHRRDAPYQGLQREIDLFGHRHRVGFYATFTALSDVDILATPYGEVRLCRDTLGDVAPGAVASGAVASEAVASGTVASGAVASEAVASGTVVHALRGPRFAGVQFHAESVLTEDGPEILAALTVPLLAPSPAPIP